MILDGAYTYVDGDSQKLVYGSTCGSLSGQRLNVASVHLNMWRECAASVLNLTPKTPMD
jgi:hypothetical protein